MKLSNRAYDILKYVALIALPALAVAYGKLAVVWGLPYAEQIPETIGILDTLLGALLMISTAQYNKDKDGEAE